jgi:hypothetical protein
LPKKEDKITRKKSKGDKKKDQICDSNRNNDNSPLINQEGKSETKIGMNGDNVEN